MIDGSFEQATISSSLEVDVATVDGSGHDLLEITGDAELRGPLVVNIAPDALDRENFTLPIITVAGTLAGEFLGLAEGALVTNVGGVDIFVTYTAGDGNDVALTTGSCAADWTGDGSVNSEDLFAYLGGFFAGAADFDGDGVTNSGDFFGFLAVFLDLPAGC